MSHNPYLAEITQLTTAIIDLQMELAVAGGDDRSRIQQELTAKIAVVDNLQGQSEAWRLGRLSQAVEDLQDLAASELARQARVGARLRRMLAAQGITPAPTTSEPTPPPLTAASPKPLAKADGSIRINVTPQDFDALSRVAQSEVGHFAQYGTDALIGGVQAVVETIINRVAHKSFPDTLQAVVDQPFQFSAINSTGSWRGLDPARPQIQTIIRGYLEARTNGRNGLLGGATHFLNPFLSSAHALVQWGNHVVVNAVAKFGDEGREDVHFHGFAPGTPLPQPHTIAFASHAAAFDARGATAGAAGSTALRNGLLATVEAELEFFDNGRSTEADAPQFSRVGDYWTALGLPYDGRSQVTFADGATGNPAWSAAFISWVIAQQNIGDDRFKGAQAHWKYVEDLVEERLANPLFDVMDPQIYAPQPGDIVHYGRAHASKFDQAAAIDHLKIDGSYPSHSDFVTQVDTQAETLRTVGGNVGNSVKAKRPDIDPSGLLKPRRVRGEDYPWIAVLRLRDS